MPQTGKRTKNRGKDDSGKTSGKRKTKGSEKVAKTVKLADIAEQFGVSTVTVSKALSGQKGVSDQMRDKIVAYAEELGYRLPSAVKQEAKRQVYTFGVLIHKDYMDKYDTFYLQMYQQINAKANSKGHFTLLEAVDESMEIEAKLPNIIKEKKIDGLVVVGRLSEKYLGFLRENRDVPVMYMDFCDDRSNPDTVVSDSYYGAYSLTKYLIGKGHKKIAYVGTVRSTSSITDRYFGYLKALYEYNIQPKAEWVIDDREMGKDVVDEEHLMQLPQEMPTAFFCNCDLVASILIRKLRQAGYRVPEDISVVGYDNYLYPGLCDLGITTYEVDMKEMARKVVNNLIGKIEGTEYRSGIHIVEGHLVEKDTVHAVL